MAGMTRFRLLPGLRRVALPNSVVQLGADPDRAMVLELPNNRFIDLLNRLDGWLDEAGYTLSARRLGVPSAEAAYLLKQLRGAGLLIDTAALSPDGLPGVRRPAMSPEASALAMRRDQPPGPVLAARHRQHVFVNGSGRLAHQVADLLRDSELGRVWCHDDGRRGKPTFAVLVNTVQPPALTARAHARRGLPYLTVAVLDGAVHVGPLVRPGASACVRCVELHYRDSLPHWRNTVAGDGDADLLEATLRGMAASMIAAVVMQHIDGEACDAEATTIQIRPSLKIDRKHWEPHHDCGCLD